MAAQALIRRCPIANATLTATIVKPVSNLATEQNNSTFSLSSIVSYSEKVETTLDLGIVTDQAVDFGTISSAKVVMIRPNQTVLVKVNGSATGLPIAGTTDAKGWLLLANPGGGITSLTITTTVNTLVDMMVLE